MYAGFDAINKVINGAIIDKNFIMDFIKEFIYGHYHFTFLFIITGLYLIVPLLRKITVDKKLTEYFLALSFIFCYMVNILIYIPKIGDMILTLSEKININFVLGYTGYFIAGYYFNRYMPNLKTKKIYIILAVFSLLLTIAGTSFGSQKLCKTTENLYRYLLPTTFFISVSIFIIFKENISKIKIKEKTINKIEKLSKLTFGIYLVHDFFNMILKKLEITTMSFNPIVFVPVLSIIVFLCSLIVSYIISKIKTLNRYVV